MSASPLQPYLVRLRRRLRLRDASRMAQRWLWTAGFAALVVLITGRFIPIPALFFWAGLPLLIWLCGVAAVSSLRPRPLQQVALKADLELALKERLSTAFELSSPPGGHSIHPELQLRQQADAQRTIEDIDPAGAFPLRLHRRSLLAAGAVFILALALISLPNPMDAILAARTAAAQAAHEQAEVVEAVKEDIESTEALTPEMQAEVARQLAELAEQLRQNPGDHEQALADLARMTEELRRHLDPGADQRQASLEAITAQLADLSGADDQAAIAEALEQMVAQLPTMNASEQQSLAAEFAQMAAQAAQSGDPTLAQALAAMSQAARTGDTQEASQGAAQISQAIQQAENDLAAQEVLEQSLAQLQASALAVAQAGSSSSQTSQTAGQNPGQNPGQGTGQSQQTGGQSGGGTKADTLPPSEGSGSANTPDLADTGATVGESGDQLFVPWDHQQGDESVQIPGQDTGGGETTITAKPDPSGGLSGFAQVPYQQVYYQYYEAAQTALTREQIPQAYRDLVRDYFTQIEP